MPRDAPPSIAVVPDDNARRACKAFTFSSCWGDLDVYPLFQSTFNVLVRTKGNGSSFQKTGLWSEPIG